MRISSVLSALSASALLVAAAPSGIIESRQNNDGLVDLTAEDWEFFNNIYGGDVDNSTIFKRDGKPLFGITLKNPSVQKPKPQPVQKPAPPQHKPAPPQPKPAPPKVHKPAPAPAVQHHHHLPGHFTGQRSGGVASWFWTNKKSDDTNGESWCWLKYDDSWKGVAIHVGKLIQSAGGNANTARKRYCGLQLNVCNPHNGKCTEAYLVDGFDPKWVKHDNSLDLTIGLFKELYHGKFEHNKHKNYINNIHWSFTGKRKSDYGFRGPAS